MLELSLLRRFQIPIELRTLIMQYFECALVITNENIQFNLYYYVREPEEMMMRHGPIELWDVSRVTNMRELFHGFGYFNHDISNWDVSNVTDMGYLFSGLSEFNQPIGKWNVTKVRDMEYMFDGASAFNQPLNNWNVSGVTTMRSMFESASAFNQPLNDWNVSRVTTMQTMFWKATAFNQPILDWDVSNVNNMRHMFAEASTFNQPIQGHWRFHPKVETLGFVNGASSFCQQDAPKDWNTKKNSCFLPLRRFKGRMNHACFWF